MKHKIDARAVGKAFTSNKVFWRGIKALENVRGNVFWDLVDSEHAVKRTGLSFQPHKHGRCLSHY